MIYAAFDRIRNHHWDGDRLQALELTFINGSVNAEKDEAGSEPLRHASLLNLRSTPQFKSAPM